LILGIVTGIIDNNGSRLVVGCFWTFVIIFYRNSSKKKLKNNKNDYQNFLYNLPKIIPSPIYDIPTDSTITLRIIGLPSLLVPL
jgi:hypothetical protein